MSSIRIGKDLALPLEAVTQTIAIMAKRRAGKSYTMRRLAEQLFKAGQQIVLVDPKGDQWGIRSAADGKGPGLAVVILGGERGDVPLEPSSGEIVAKLVVEERVSIVLDLSLFRKYEVATFMTAFLENLYRLKAKEIYRTPVMLVIDEADAIAPQKPQKGEERMLGAAEDIVRRGGQRGIGCVLVTQRSAVLNKNVLTQAQMLVALRTIAPQDLAAMDAWIQVHGEPEQRSTLMESLPSLPVGDAWFWSPGWPTTDGIFKRVHVLPIETFDSGATPKPGEKRTEPKTAADVDLEALKRQMAATIEKAKAEDPKQLRGRIAELERELKKKTATAPATASGPRREDLATIAALRKALEHAMKFIVEINAKDFFKAAGDSVDKEQIQKAIASAAEAVKRMVEQHLDHRNRELERLQRTGERVVADLQALLKHQDVTLRVDVRHNEPFTVSPAPRSTPRQMPPVVQGSGAGDLSKAERQILTVLAQMQPEPLEQDRLAILAGYSPNTGHFNNTVGALRSREFVTKGWPIQVLEAGFTALGDYNPLPRGRELLEYWKGRLGRAEKLILTAAAEAYPEPLTKGQLAAQAGYQADTGHFNNSLGRLRTMRLLVGRSDIKASEVFFQ